MPSPGPSLMAFTMLDIQTPMLLLATVAGLAVSYGILYFYRKFNTSTSLPPSPPADFLVGHLWKLPRGYLWRAFADWAKHYGEHRLYILCPRNFNIVDPGNIFYLNFLGNGVIVLNSIEDARELLDRRSALYSSRPKSIVMGEMFVPLP